MAAAATARCSAPGCRRVYGHDGECTPARNAKRAAIRREQAFEELLETVEKEWPNLRVPTKRILNPPATVGARLRRAAEKARAAL